jgi:ribosome-associated translation inhibitor RaiA
MKNQINFLHMDRSEAFEIYANNLLQSCSEKYHFDVPQLDLTLSLEKKVFHLKCRVRSPDLNCDFKGKNTNPYALLTEIVTKLDKKIAENRRLFVLRQKERKIWMLLNHENDEAFGSEDYDDYRADVVSYNFV